MSRKLFVFAAFVVLVLLGIAPAMAYTGNQETIVSVKRGVIEVPGRVLEPGRYDLKFLNDEHIIVDISTAAGEQIGFYQVVPISRNLRKNRVQLLLQKQSHSVPELKGFFYPEMKTGYEFLYPSSHVNQVTRLHSNSSSQGR